MNILAKNFNTREELENHIRSLTDEEKRSSVIKLRKMDIKRLRLSSSTTVHGVPCDAPQKKKEKLPNIRKLRQVKYG